MKLKILIPMESVNAPILSEVILETGVKINISSCTVSSKGGRMIVEIPDEKTDAVRTAFAGQGASAIPLTTPIRRNKEECVDCGACISVCPSKTYSFNERYELEMNIETCTGCGLCVSMCPHQALSLEGQE